MNSGFIKVNDCFKAQLQNLTKGEKNSWTTIDISKDYGTFKPGCKKSFKSKGENG
jgi:hypothetical protein